MREDRERQPGGGLGGNPENEPATFEEWREREQEQAEKKPKKTNQAAGGEQGSS